MIKIDMEMPEDCIHCPFYCGSLYGGACAADIYDVSFDRVSPDCERHPSCPLQEVEE